MASIEEPAFDRKLLHRLFAAAALLLLGATVWLLAVDHCREWKDYQRRFRRIQLATMRWSQLAADADKDEAQSRRLAALLAERRATWFTPRLPFLGKKWLELPILDAFQSPLVIDNLWTENLTIDFHHKQVLRYDRCTTCHRAVTETTGGSAVDPLYLPERELTFSLSTPPLRERRPEPGRGNGEPGAALEQLYGLRLTEEGAPGADEVTISYVRPDSTSAGGLKSPAARAQPAGHQLGRDRPTVAEIRRRVAAGELVGLGDGGAPGLRAGDVILEIDGHKVDSAGDCRQRLLIGAKGGEPIRVKVRRGYPHPFVSHPRLDLYVGSASPHPLARVGCTICHEGQGRATSFAGASHAPNDPATRRRWRRQYGWFDNPHWPYPMYAKRFAQSTCLKCHHDVLELEPSRRFPDPPAPKLLEGYRLVRRYGCFGCHEINGYDASGRRVGPDMRLEPSDPDAAPPSPDTEPPGTLRKVGPSLRHVQSAVSAEYLYDRIRDPRHFRADTPMPRTFGQWDHLEGEALATARRLEPIEIQGMVAYLLDSSRPVESVSPVEDRPQRDTVDVRIARGKKHFELGGCLACHRHKDFPDVQSDQGPDLSATGDKLSGPAGRKWLYGWIASPGRHNRRTRMPEAPLDPLPGEEGTDPIADVVEYLLESKRADWKPAEMPPRPDGPALDELVLAHLEKTFHPDRAKRYLRQGIPESIRRNLRGAAEELVASGGRPPSTEQKLRYVGRRSIAKYGCYGCHDIAGFEHAKPIGPALGDWGRKDPTQLAFRHVARYLREGRGGKASEPVDPFYVQAVEDESRIGFAYQKLREPRSFDYKRTGAKAYNEWLKMPRFNLSRPQREAIVTFVLGLVAAPPAQEFVYRPSPRQKAITDGRGVLERYNCGGCHTLELERWTIAYPSGAFPAVPPARTFPFLSPQFPVEAFEKSKETDARGLRRAAIAGMARVDQRGRPELFVYDEDEGDFIDLDELDDDDSVDPAGMAYAMELWKPALLEGRVYPVGSPLPIVPASTIRKRQPARGGDLARRLLPRVLALEKSNKGAQARGWVPPPLVGEGRKVKPDWLYAYLLDPQRIRPASVVRMPRYDLSPEEAAALVGYFAAVDGVDYPYPFPKRRRPDYLAATESAYQAKLARLPAGSEAAGKRTRLGDAMRIVANRDFCATCHRIADYEPDAADSAKAPNLADVYKRLRPEYVRRWIAKPSWVLPYTAMQENITYDPNAPHLGQKIPQSLCAGASIEQLDALVDLLVNFDTYAAGKSSIAPLVEKAEKRRGERQEPKDE